MSIEPTASMATFPGLTLPVIYVVGDNLPAAWETAVVQTWERGAQIATQYDKPGDPPSRDVTLCMTIKDPFAEPRIHRAFPGGIADLEVYRQEVVDGIHDHWIAPEKGHWEYTYHERLFDYKVLTLAQAPPTFEVRWKDIDQIQYIIDTLAEAPHSRRAQAITWKPWEDCGIQDPACFCAGTKISTPTGLRNVEEINNGDSVYAFNLEEGSLEIVNAINVFNKLDDCIEIRTHDRSIKVSLDQKLLVNIGNENKWKSTKEIKRLLDNNKDVRLVVSSVVSYDEITENMMIGFLHGDAWLSSGYCGGDRNILRCNLGFSLHPQSEDTWLIDWLTHNSKNKINISEKYCSSSLVRGLSKKIEITDKYLWEYFKDKGCPIGRKGEEIIWDEENATDEECMDFLTGIYSAEGRVVCSSDFDISIQLGMNWKECVDLISRILDRLGIEHKRYTSGDTHKIYIQTNSGIISAVNTFDMRLDSRKQSKWLILKEHIAYSKELLEIRKQNIDMIRKLRQNGVTLRELRKIQGFNPRILDVNYEPQFQMAPMENLFQNAFDKTALLSITDTEYIGEHIVYDFEVNHPDHAMLANGIVSHNCLQSFWCRIFDDELVMNARMRSNDAFKAAFMNIYAFTDIQRLIAEGVSKKLGREIKVGQYTHMVDSFHIYSHYFSEFQGFLKMVENRTFEDRTWDSTSPMVQEIFEEAKENIKKSIEEEKRTGKIGIGI